MSKKTVFIVGAGASNEVNLPTGNELKKIIALLLNIRFDEWGDQLLSGDKRLTLALKSYANSIGETIHAILPDAWHICEALPQAISIDHLIDSQRDNERVAICGKLAIIRSILQAERGSLLYLDKRINQKLDLNSLENTWFLPFFQLLTENCSKNDLEKRFQYLTLIIFNYDRCIEQYMYHALQIYYRITPAEAAEIVNSIKIFHPYGSVGVLPWSNKSKFSSVEFGEELRPINLLKLISEIYTFTEGTDPNSSEIIQIRERISNADNLAFIGFAFHPINMQLICSKRPEDDTNSFINCYATAYGISNSDQAHSEDLIKSLSNRIIITKMVSQKCYDFFYEFRRSLSFEN